MKRILAALLTVAFAVTAAEAVQPASPAAPRARSERLEGYDTEAEVRARLSSMPLHPVEGLWEFPADGGMVAVERCALIAGGTRQYRMVVVSVANRALLPGTVLGTFAATAQANVYDGQFFTALSADGMTPTSPRQAILELDGETSRLSMRRVRKGLTVNLWRLLPYIFRFSVTRRDDSPRNLDGWIRLFPPPAVPAEPRYL